MKKTILILIVIGVGVWFWTNKKTTVINQMSNQAETQNEDTDECINASYIECKDYPQYDLPLKYFSIKDATWGSIGGDGEEGTIEEYNQVALDSREVYQSYPTTKITISDYSSKIVPISNKKFGDIKNKIIEIEGEDSYWVTEIEKQYQEYGQVAVHFWDEFLDIEMFNTFDVDDDGIDEKILGLNFVGRADGGSYNVVIVKGNNVIFSVDEDNSFILPHETGNGFYVEWRNPTDESARCCSTGFLRTRFVYEDGKFVPIYEQEVRYFMVGSNTDY